jgi:uncharacterized protein (DUF305 family)
MTSVSDRDRTDVTAGTGAPPGQWDNRPVYLCLVIVVLAAVWLGTTPWSNGSAPGDKSAEAGFVRDMSTHHAQAVEMAELVRFRTRDPAIRLLAGDIALTQQGQIGQVSGWLEEWGLPETGVDPAMTWMGHPIDGPMPGMATRPQVTASARSSGVNADVLFLRAMIPHHQAAILMAEAVLNRTDRPDVRRFARGTITAQRGEIAVMRRLLQEKGGSLLTPRGTMPGIRAADDGFSLGSAATTAARLLPLAAGVLAAAWLVLEARRRRVYDPA